VRIRCAESYTDAAGYSVKDGEYRRDDPRAQTVGKGRALRP
jgi:hypothetical protein